MINSAKKEVESEGDCPACSAGNYCEMPMTDTENMCAEGYVCVSGAMDQRPYEVLLY
jgi:hypothetical protein